MCRMPFSGSALTRKPWTMADLLKAAQGAAAAA
jgi:hypothetical protein